MSSLGFNICNVAAEVFEFLHCGVKSHDSLGTHLCCHRRMDPYRLFGGEWAGVFIRLTFRKA